MSILMRHNQEQNCQTILTALYDAVTPFHTEVESVLSQSDQTVNLSLSPTQISIYVALTADKQRRTVIVTKNTDTAKKIAAQIKGWQNITKELTTNWHIISAPLVEQEIAADVTTNTSLAYHHLLSSNENIIITNDALTTPPPSKTLYQKNSLQITTNQISSLQDITNHLSKHGFARQRTILEPGTFRVRGEAIDIKHPAHSTHHYTITLFGNKIESITEHVGRRSQTIKSITIPPVDFPKKTGDWADILFNTLLLKSESGTSQIGAQTIITNSHTPQVIFPIKEIEKSDASTKTLFLFYQNHDHIEQFIRDQGQREIITCQNELAEYVLWLTTDNWQLRTENHIFPKENQNNASPITYERALELVGELVVGKPAVHADHGIGIYEGLQNRTIEKHEKEYLVLRYAEGDSISVPVEYAHKVSAYIGESSPQIHRLSGTLWQKAKKQAQVDAAALAKELLTISQKRTASTRTPYAIDPTTEEELDNTFPHELTDDQVRTWEEIKHDLKQAIPMDRLVVGDVGFGKTEMAIRAAYHTVQNGQQVAVLAPTTLLVQQHYDTFRNRLPKISNDIHLLSRFVSSRDQKTIKQSIEKNKAKIVVGTHGLLSKTINWKELGLVIIDEEQRFGVKQKEHFKKVRASLDVLSLSATPIPRTLSMALSGLRTLSLIQTPPKNRKDIQTNVKRVSDGVLKEAIQQELDRNGQIYIVAPKIRHLASIKEHVTALFPEIRTAIAHARLPDKQLSHIIHQFDSGELDALISSTIVENGLDLEGANTMIVWHAPNLGLGELYQLRGRIGRRQRQGYAYFLYNQERLTGIQRERLTALTEASRLGSGWELARRDLEMRGAGNLLGAAQSGSVNSVGLGLYLDMVNEQVETEGLADTTVQLPISATIPAHYIQDATERTRWYKRLARSHTQEQQEKLTTQLTQSYGPPPKETNNLLLLLQLQRAAKKFNISKITNQTISPSDEDPYERLIIESRDLPRILKEVGHLGNWQVRQSEITWDVDAITPELIEKIINSLT